MVPSDVRHLGRVPTVYEEQLRRTVPPLLLGLWLINAREVPNHDAAVAAGRCEQVAVHGAKANLVDLFLVLAEREELAFDVSGVPDGD